MLWSYTVQWTLIQVWCLRHYFSSLKGTGQLLIHPDFYWYQVTPGARDQFTSRPRFQVFKVHSNAAICLPLSKKASQMSTDVSNRHPTSKNTFHYVFVLFTITISVLPTFKTEYYNILSLSFYCVWCRGLDLFQLQGPKHMENITPAFYGQH